MIRLLAITALCVTLLALPAAAQRLHPVAVGETAPAIAAVDQAGAKQTFETLSGEKGLVLAFVRSVEWCPFCQKQVKDINARLEDFRVRGYNVAVLSYDAPETAQAFAKKNGLALTILSDRRSEIIEAFGLLNTEHPKGTRFYGIPHPAIYVIAPDGKVTGYFAEKDYKLRPNLDEVLASLGPAPAPEPAEEPPVAEEPAVTDIAPEEPPPAEEPVAAEEPAPVTEQPMTAPAPAE